jgi:hypothetical protein
MKDDVWCDDSELTFDERQIAQRVAELVRPGKYAFYKERDPPYLVTDDNGGMGFHTLDELRECFGWPPEPSTPRRQ